MHRRDTSNCFGARVSACWPPGPCQASLEAFGMIFPRYTHGYTARQRETCWAGKVEMLAGSLPALGDLQLARGVDSSNKWTGSFASARNNLKKGAHPAPPTTGRQKQCVVYLYYSLKPNIKPKSRARKRSFFSVKTKSV
jgi:hypothetical protein